MLICNSTDIRYLTGVDEGISWLIVFRNGTVAITRHMLVHEVTEGIPECEVLLPSANSTDRPDLEAFVVSELRRRSATRVFIEMEKITAVSYLHLARCCEQNRVILESTSRIVASLRIIKDDEEQQAIRRCVDIAERSLRQLISEGAAGFIGKTEREIAVELERIMIDFGADRQGFPATGIIIASGPNSSRAHHRPGSRRIESGDPVLIDWGAELAGYRSDLTRTFFMQSVPEFAMAAYPVVEHALQKASGILRPGVMLGAMDDVARQTVTLAGFPEFTYGVGHGVGLDIHEEPWIRSGSEERLEANMITTLEPGIYLHGIGGIRIENLFRITPHGAENLASLPTCLDEMILQ
jgi:Xaa-Pro aminopeptidase